MLPDLRGDRVGRRRLREEVQELAVGAHEVQHDRVVDQIIIIVLVVDGPDRTVDAVRLRRRLALRRRPHQEPHALVKVLRINPQLPQGVAPRVQRHEQWRRRRVAEQP